MTTTTTRSARQPRAARPGYTCSECGWTATKWAGRCGECQAWGSVVEDGPTASGPRTTT
ncbi:MAG: DNA repair protein RadA, partial [Cellulomonadaceae bacterium]|nr:DNA repair protein RadA [Cellulomonadaceae bacterium]